MSEEFLDDEPTKEDQEIIDWATLDPNYAPDYRQMLANFYGLFEENYRNHPKKSAVSRGAKSCMDMLEKNYFR